MIEEFHAVRFATKRTVSANLRVSGCLIYTRESGSLSRVRRASNLKETKKKEKKKDGGFNGNDDINTRHGEHCRHAESFARERENGWTKGGKRVDIEKSERARWWTGGSSSER